MRTRFNTLIAAVVVVALVIGALALTGCGSKGTDLVGEWQAEGSPEVIVFTETEVKFTADQVFPYTIDEEAKTITLTLEGEAASTSAFALSEDGKTLTITATSNGQEAKAVFLKLSDNGDAEPRIETTGGSAEETVTP